MENTSFPQFENEPFWVYFNRLEDFISYHGYDLWEACEICYHNLTKQTRDIVESMFNGRFRALSIDDAWDFYVWFARDSYNRGHGCSNASIDDCYGPCSMNNESCMPSCAPIPHINDATHISSVDPHHMLAHNSFPHYAPQLSSPLKTLEPNIESSYNQIGGSLRKLEMNSNLEPNEMRYLEIVRSQMEMLKKLEESNEVVFRKNDEMESQLSSILNVNEVSTTLVDMEDDDDDCFKSSKVCKEDVREPMSEERV